ncbi:hypothetical protein KFK09_016685 [Dendrobium nobile]|uniref:Transmembrane protein n=1 Tax=Dendrobium nobile TaxID=94219 RepID=A0A8T3B068_DENNO|nr:hypothetical protein KFK09_016685 [Dendrobium nobile]
MAVESFEVHGGGEVMFCVIIMWLSIISMIIFSCIDHPRSSNKHSRKSSSHGCSDGSYLSF